MQSTPISDKLNFWDLIESNKRDTIHLFIILTELLLILGFIIGFSISGVEGGIHGVLWVLAIWIIFATISYFVTEQIILDLNKALLPDKHTFKELYNILDEVIIAAGLNFKPDILIIDEKAPNAFVLGKKPEQSVIVLTAGLLATFTRDEIQAVMAHEIAHIIHRDNLVMTNAVALGWTILFLAFILNFIAFPGGSSDNSENRSEGAGGRFFFIFAAFLFSIFSIVTTIIILKTISKKRVYLADATAVRLTRYPAALISALDKVAFSLETYHNKNRITAILFFADPYGKKNILSAHPSLEKRINILKTLGDSASYYDYYTAFLRVTNKKRLMPVSFLHDNQKVPVIDKAVSQKPLLGNNKSQTILINDIIKVVQGFAFIKCNKCGLRFKVPKDFDRKEFYCPRCGNAIKNPHGKKFQDYEEEKENINNDIIIKVKDGVTHYYYKRKDVNSWETFSCVCNAPKQLSPSFTQKQFYCSNCGRKIEII